MTYPTLPSTTGQIAATLTQVAAAGNFAGWEQTIAYGYILIETMYRPHPIKRPFDLIRKWQARRWWEQTVRTTGQQLQVAMMQASLRDFTTRINRPIDQDNFDFHEANRRRQLEFDSQLRIKEAITIAKGQAKAQTHGQIAVMHAQTTLTPPPPDPMAQYEAMTKKIAEIEHDPHLTDEQKRRRIDLLLRAHEDDSRRRS